MAAMRSQTANRRISMFAQLAVLYFLGNDMAFADMPKLTMQGPPEQSSASVPKDAFGQPCLNVEAAARGQAIIPQMMDHVVSVKNNCPRLIKIKICYANSDRCLPVEVQAYKRVDTIIGSMRGVNFFRFTIHQK